jgi:hypothetical protein
MLLIRITHCNLHGTRCVTFTLPWCAFRFIWRRCFGLYQLSVQDLQETKWLRFVCFSSSVVNHCLRYNLHYRITNLSQLNLCIVDFNIYYFCTNDNTKWKLKLSTSALHKLANIISCGEAKCLPPQPTEQLHLLVFTADRYNFNTVNIRQNNSWLSDN